MQTDNYMVKFNLTYAKNMIEKVEVEFDDNNQINVKRGTYNDDYRGYVLSVIIRKLSDKYGRDFECVLEFN